MIRWTQTERFKMIEDGQYILLNGCSFTFGGELPGWKTNDHWEYTFGNHLSQKLKLPFRNMAMCGNSNDKIFRTTMESLMFEPPPALLIILWSSLGRKEFASFRRLEGDEALHIPFDPRGWEQKIPNIRTEKFWYNSRDDSEPQDQKDILKEWYDKVYTIETAAMEQMNYMRIVQFTCDQLKIPLIMGNMKSEPWKVVLHSLMRRKNYPQYADYINDSRNLLRWECRMGMGSDAPDTIGDIADAKDDVMPNGHPGLQSQKIFAGRLYDIIKEQNILPLTDQRV